MKDLVIRIINMKCEILMFVYILFFRAFLHQRITGLCSNTTFVLVVTNHHDVAFHSPTISPAKGKKNKWIKSEQELPIFT